MPRESPFMIVRRRHRSGIETARTFSHPPVDLQLLQPSFLLPGKLLLRHSPAPLDIFFVEDGLLGSRELGRLLQGIEMENVASVIVDDDPWLGRFLNRPFHW